MGNELSSKWKLVSGYFWVLLAFWALSVYLWLTLGYEETFLTLNQYHFEPHDQASLYFFTHLADGVILPAIMLIWMWRKDPALAITAVIAVFATGLVTQMGKMVVFPDWHRPPKVFEHLSEVLIVAPHPPKIHSFPSGHATSFATGGLFFAYFLSKRIPWMGIAVGLFTIFLCYTRVTIGVHFPGDIFVGSMVGAIGAFTLLLFLYPWIGRLIERKGGEKWKGAAKWVTLVAGVLLVAQFVHLIWRT